MKNALTLILGSVLMLASLGFLVHLFAWALLSGGEFIEESRGWWLAFLGPLSRVPECWAASGLFVLGFALVARSVWPDNSKVAGPEFPEPSPRTRIRPDLLKKG